MLADLLFVVNAPRKAWGFTAQINGKQVRRYKAEWTQDDAEAELAKALLKIEPEKPKADGITFGQAVEKYLAAKSRKRSVSEDRRILGTSLELLRDGYAPGGHHCEPDKRVQGGPAF